MRHWKRSEPCKSYFNKPLRTITWAQKYKQQGDIEVTIIDECSHHRKKM